MKRATLAESIPGPANLSVESLCLAPVDDFVLFNVVFFLDAALNRTICEIMFANNPTQYRLLILCSIPRYGYLNHFKY